MNKRSGVSSRKNITAAAVGIFAKKGYKQTTMREVAQKARISVGAMSHYRKQIGGLSDFKDSLCTTLLFYLRKNGNEIVQ